MMRFMSSFANTVTLFRICLIPFFLYVVIQEFFLFASAMIALLAALDMLDGYLARRYNEVTKVGILLDPIADKSLVMITAIYFALKGFLPIWFVLALFYRDFALLIGMLALLLYQKEAVVSSNFMGKISAGFNVSLMFFLCLTQRFPSFYPLTRFVFYGASIFVVVSFFSYSLRWFELFGKQKA